MTLVVRIRENIIAAPLRSHEGKEEAVGRQQLAEQVAVGAVIRIGQSPGYRIAERHDANGRL